MNEQRALQALHIMHICAHLTIMTKRKRSSGSDAAASSSVADMRLTPGAVRTMVCGGPDSSPHVVRLVNIRPVENDGAPATHVCAAVCDDEHTTEAFVVNKQLKSLSFFRTDGSLSYVVSVRGYVTSPANLKDVFLCITSLDILRVEQAQPITQVRPPRFQQRVQGGIAATFLLDRAPLFSDRDLAGSGAFVSLSNHHPQATMTTTTTEFIAHYSAIKTLHHSSTNTDSTLTQNYMSAIREFAAAQLDRQKASLTTNSEKYSADKASMVTSQHKTALEAALAHAETKQELTPATLQQWHALLCGGGLVPEAGTFRKKKVRAGATDFCPPESVTQEINKVCQAIRSLESRLDSTKSPALLAAAVMIGILDVHPFSDGNGRLSRIATNWALRRAGVPFVVNMFATPAQRREYVTAIEATRRNLSTVAVGSVSEETLVDVMSRSGLLMPLVHLVMEQVSRAAVECNKLVAEKSVLASDEQEARAARRFREKAAAGTCLICFDDNPNVATLCCGKAVHLNCIAQWLSSRNSCPQCRTELPSLPQRVAAPPVEAAEQETEDTTDWDGMQSDTTTDDYEHFAVGGGYGHPLAAQNDDTTEDSSQGSTEEVGNDDTTFDDTTTVGDDNPHDDTTEDTTDDIPDVPTMARPPRLVCVFHNCRNKPATDCTNGGCGRCCVLYGSFACTRHNA